MKGLHFTTINTIREKAQNRGPPTKISGLSALWERFVDFVWSSENSTREKERENIHVIHFFVSPSEMFTRENDAIFFITHLINL